MPTIDRSAGKTKQGATPIVDYGWQISITMAMFINNATSYRHTTGLWK
jgi:hypothetical protein